MLRCGRHLSMGNNFRARDNKVSVREKANVMWACGKNTFKNNRANLRVSDVFGYESRRACQQNQWKYSSALSHKCAGVEYCKNRIVLSFI